MTKVKLNYKIEILKIIGASLLAQAITQLIVTVIYKLIYQSERAGYWQGFGASIIATAAFIPLMIVSSVVSLKLFRFKRWLRLGLVAGTATALGCNILSQSYSNSRYQYQILVPAVISIFVFVLTLSVDAQIQKHLSSYPASLLLAAIILAITIGITYPLNTKLTDYQLSKDNQIARQSINNGLDKIDFAIYMPKWLPKGLTIKVIRTPNPSNDAIYHSPTRLELDTGPNGDNGLFFNEFRPSKEYSPPTNCGPYSAGTVSVGPAGYTVTCKEVVSIDNIPVYMGSYGATSYPPEYDYYFIKGGTEITIEDTMGYPLPTDDINNLVNGLYEININSLPSALLQQQ